jgi:hypothetical protein
MPFLITNKNQSEMLLAIIALRDATVIKRDKHKMKRDYYENLLDCLLLLDETNLCTHERNQLFFSLRKKYWEHKAKYDLFKMRYLSLQTNIDLLLSYEHVVLSL